MKLILDRESIVMYQEREQHELNASYRLFSIFQNT